MSNSDFFIHELARVESTTIGAGTRIWAFAHVLPGAQIGRDCNICDHTFIENDVLIGDRVTVKCGVQLWDGLRVGDDVFIGPNATFTNDAFPRSKQSPDVFFETHVRAGASIGANATIFPGLTIGERAMIEAGAVVTRSVPPRAIVSGNPARITGYVDTELNVRLSASSASEAPTKIVSGISKTSVRDVTLHHFPLITDMRGNLLVGEFERSVPFTPKRYFMVLDVPSAETRGEHAHIECHQFLVCVKGSCSVVVDDGVNREEIPLDNPGLGLYLPPMTWGIQYRYTQDAVLLVFASDYYVPEDYIRDYDEFRRLAILEEK